MRPKLTFLLCTAALASVLVPASGQNLLDRNLEVGSNGRNRPAPGNRFADRNFIITNNVVGGRGFRGNVGYGAPDAFRGQAGSDDLFSFRADSAISDVNFIGQRFTYEQLRFGQVLGTIEYRRASQGATPQARAEGFFRENEYTLARLRMDRFSFESSTPVSTEFRNEPTILGAFTNPQDGTPSIMQASNFSGISAMPLSSALQVIGLTSYDHARLAEDIALGRDVDTSRLGVSFQNRYEDLLVDTRAESTALEGEAEGESEREEGEIELRVTYTNIQDSVARRFAAAEEVDVDATEPVPAETIQSLQQRLETLRQRLSEMGRPEEEVTGPRDVRGSRRTGSPSAPPIEGTDDSVRAPDTPFRAEDFGLILRHGQRLDHLAVKDGTRFAELVLLGEEALGRGEYFWAERRFHRALRFTPGHPLATVGLAHAQLGAGLYVAASVTLHNLFTYQPEMIDVRFDDRLIPNRPRLQRAVVALQEQIETLPDREERGMLLAYVGRLLDDEAVVREGLTVYREAAPDSTLLPLLESIWLAPDEAPGTTDGDGNDR